MPYRKTSFIKNRFYHIYNRGVEKRDIFLDSSDYLTFIDICHYYLKPRQRDLERPVLSSRTGLSQLGMFEHQIEVISYCLMPNHFHLSILQLVKNGITQLIRHLGTAYSMYFNHRYNRVGSLFQGRFKAKWIKTDEYLLYLTRYQHRNPGEITGLKSLKDYPWSSYPEYLGVRRKGLSNPKMVLSHFTRQNPNISYQSYVEEIEFSEEMIKDYIFDE